MCIYKFAAEDTLAKYIFSNINYPYMCINKYAADRHPCLTVSVNKNI